MAKQTEIAYEPTKEWADYQTGGTRIDAADLNNMEGGIADACAAVDQLRTKRLPTYLVATGGDEATQDVYQEAILGPCLIVDLATATTYYDNGEDGEGHERTKLTSGADIDDLRDSLSRKVSTNGLDATLTTYDMLNILFRMSVDTDDGQSYWLTITDSGISLYDRKSSSNLWEK